MRVSRAVGVLLVVMGLICASAPAVAAEPVLRGVAQPSLIEEWTDDGPAIVAEFSDKLGADVVRINLRWSESEPRPGVYDNDYLGRAAGAAAAVKAAGMQSLVVVYETPRWASDRSLWGTAPYGAATGRYHPYYPPGVAHLDRFRAFMKHVATKLRGNVLGYSCWIEPNLWTYLYPQRTGDDAGFAPHRYARMLAAFSAGVRAGDPAALVVAGETSPSGDDSRLRTSPQRFARVLRDTGCADLFDAYSHHPYAVGGTRRIAPTAMPRHPRHTVVLANLQTLLDIFPDKPFYLTEYGYATSFNMLFGVDVDEAAQAAYLQRAYSYVERYPQVKLLVWFPRQDWGRGDSYRDPFGVYTGLRAIDGRKKRAYYAFAGGNTLTLTTPEAVDRGAVLTLRGTLSSASMGPLRGKELVVEGRKPGRSWVFVRRCTTNDEGRYVAGVRPLTGAHWRVRWRGVTGSMADWVAVR